MTPEEAELVREAGALTLAFIRGDNGGQDILLGDLDQNPRKADGFVLLAIVVSTSVTQFTEQDVSQIWGELPGTSPLLPADMINRSAVVMLANGVRNGDPEAIQAGAGALGNVGVALLSAIDLVLAALTRLTAVSGDTAEDWLSRFTLGAAGGIGVDG